MSACGWRAAGLLALLSACGQGGDRGDFHARILARDLAVVSYLNGIDMIEAKTIAEAYLYVYGNELGAAPQVYIRDRGDLWQADIAVGTGINPRPASVAPVTVSKVDGTVRWALGPEVARVELADAPPHKSYLAVRGGSDAPVH